LNQLKKIKPALPLITLDALASALEISASDLVGLAENHTVLTRQTESVHAETLRSSGLGLESISVANFDKCKIFRATAKAPNVINSMQLHEDCHCHEICYVLRGSLEIRVKSNNYKLNTNEVILFDGTFGHG